MQYVLQKLLQVGHHVSRDTDSTAQGGTVSASSARGAQLAAPNQKLDATDTEDPVAEDCLSTENEKGLTSQEEEAFEVLAH